MLAPRSSHVTTPLRTLVVRRDLFRRSAWLVAAIVAASVTWLDVREVTSEARRLVSDYGTPERVPVAVQDLEPGTSLSRDHVTWKMRPRGEGPKPARSPVGRRVAHRLLAGEVIAESRLAGSGDSNPSSGPLPGRVALAIPLEFPIPPLERGDEVHLFSPTSPGKTSSNRLVSDATVLEVRDETLVVTVPVERAADVASWIANGPTIVMVGGA